MFAALSIKEWTAIIVLATFALYIVYRLVVPRRFDRRVLRGC